MTYYDALKIGLSYIEKHLESDLTVSAVAKAAGYSQFHYSRIFSKILHCSIYDYIMKRKLTAACYCLLETNLKIIDVAFKYNFGSHESFTRAFKKLFGVTPSNLETIHLSRTFEAFDEDYLNYLYHLQVEKGEDEIISGYFIGQSAFNINSMKPLDALLLMSTYNTEPSLTYRYILSGDFVTQKPEDLAYQLNQLTCSLILSKGTLKNTYRCLREIILKDSPNYNFILLDGLTDQIKIYLPKNKV